MKLRFELCAATVAVVAMCAASLAQEPFEPAQELDAQTPAAAAMPGSQPAPQKQADVDWLTSYMLVYEGYRFDHLPALEQSFEKMSPTQLHTLRQFLERKHALELERQATLRQMQERQASKAAASQQRQQQALNPLPSGDAADPDAMAEVEDARINQMHAEADANAKGELFNGRNIEMYGNDPFGDITGRGVGFGGDGIH